MDTLELLLHPVRVRIVHALFGGARRTTSELCERLPDVSRATLYRQISLLVEGGVVEVAGEQRVHGAVERHYRLHRSNAVIDPESAAAMTLEDHRRGFAAAVAALVAAFNSYLDRPGASPTADSVGYRQIPVWLSSEELNDLVHAMRDLIADELENAARSDRRRYLLSPILFPIEEYEGTGC
jgi:DNA-binding transcriptional ArsR family regulator